MRKIALALIAVAAVVFGAGQAAHAQYSQSVTVNPSEVTAGENFTVTYSNCINGETVTFEFQGVALTDTCDNGVASVVFPAPTTPGTYPGTAVGSQSGVVENWTVNVASGAVAPDPTSPSGGLPATGSSGIDTTTTIAVGLLVVGIGMFVVTQVRRRPAVA